MSDAQAPPEVELAKMAIEVNGVANGGGADAAPAATFKDQFKAFSKFGDIKSDGKHITLSQSDKWMKQAKVIDKKITTTDTAIHFKKLKSLKVTVTDYNKFLEDLAITKKVDLEEIKSKMANCGAPGIIQRTVNSIFRFLYVSLFQFLIKPQFQPGKAAATVNRLTDASKYTGSHKERFDDSGKGKGIAGRKELVDKSGYVSGYQHKDTYDKTH